MNYALVYSQLIEQARKRVLFGYSEMHHVVPKSHGGDNSPENLVKLTAREHYIAHKLLFLAHNDTSTAKAFRLMCDGLNKPRGRAYEEAKQVYAATMRGDNNPAKRLEVRQKISLALRSNHPYTGIKRPQHAALMRSYGHWVGDKNPFFGAGATQTGAKNHMARTVRGEHPVHGVCMWSTLKLASEDLGVTIQAVCQALRKQQKSRGWTLEYVR